MKLSADKKIALKKIASWLRDKDRSSQHLTIGGYAGTGKTTLSAVLRRLLAKRNPKLKVAFLSYTGKAARVLKNTLNQHQAYYKQDFVGTIHSFIYEPMIGGGGEIVGWDKKSKLDVQLIVVDEASMINRSLWSDLRSFAVPIIALGDHGQLPPIHGEFNLMENPEIKLEKIHRQAFNNPIIKLSIKAREKGEIAVGQYGPGVEKIDQTDTLAQEKVQSLLHQFDQQTLVLCGYNHTRVKLNDFMRQEKFFEPQPEPMINDRVICLKNNHQKKIYNGMLGRIIFLETLDDDYYYAEIELDDNDDLYKGQIYRHQFGATHSRSYTKKEAQILKEADLFDFGYAMTVHKAQGSQANRVILFEERFKQMSDDEWRRWLYTGITRAEKELYLIGQ